MQAQKTKNCNKHHYFKVNCFILYLFDNGGLGVFCSPGVWMLEHHPGQTNDYEIGICCFSPKHAA